MKYGNKTASIIERAKNVLPNTGMWIKAHSIDRPFYYPDKETGTSMFFIIKELGNGAFEWTVKG